MVRESGNLKPPDKRDQSLPAELPAYSFFKSNPDADQIDSIRLLAVGDIGLSGRIASQRQTTSFAPFVQEIKDFLQTGDIVFGNLETPLIESPTHNSFFAAPPHNLTLLKQSGFTLLNLANNHITDHGPEGLRSTLDELSAAGITPLGAGHTQDEAGQLTIIEAGKLRVGWLAQGRTLQTQPASGPCFQEFDETELVKAIEAGRDQVDILIVSLHMGLMYLDYPDPSFKAMAERFVDAGADLILMHHAHVLQGIQIVGGRGVICYNLGNFMIDWQEGYVQTEIMVDEQQEGGIFVFDIGRDGIISGTVLPTYMDDDCRVHWATGERGQRIITRLQKISDALKTDYTPEFERQRIERNAGHSANVITFHIKQGNWGLVLKSLAGVRPRHLGLIWGWLRSRLRPAPITHHE